MVTTHSQCLPCTGRCCHVPLTTSFLKAASVAPLVQHSRSIVRRPSVYPPISLSEHPPPSSSSSSSSPKLPANSPPPTHFPLPTEAQSKPYYSDYSPTRLLIHKMCTSSYLDLFITIVIGLNVITMSMEHYHQPQVRGGGILGCLLQMWIHGF